MSDLRYGLYLRPSYEMSRAQVEVHKVLWSQYGLRAAGKFMPHVTIKGFFRTRAGVEEMVDGLDAVLEERPAFTVYNSGVVSFGRDGIALDVHAGPGGDPNEPLQELYRDVMDVMLPVVDTSCEFTRQERELNREKFLAHLTLAMADIPARFFEEVLQFVREAEPIGPSTFPAEILQLFAFRCRDWQGSWWETLRWELLHSRRLAD